MIYPATATMKRHSDRDGKPRRAVKGGPYREGATNLGPLIPCSHSGKIAYWMYQIYCTTGIQKW
jgi:hypothetical protein